MIASSAIDLRRYRASAAAYLQDGLPPEPQWASVRKSTCHRTSSRPRSTYLAEQGARDFYEGDLAKSVAADVQGAGGALSASDLAAFARICASRCRFPIAAARSMRRRN